MNETPSPKMVEVPGAEFLMGCESGRDDERPLHRVWVSSFEMGATTVTNVEYLRFVKETNGKMPPSFLDESFSSPLQPVVAVKWSDAVAYCEWLSQKTHEIFRLPTEAEWELAIRAGKEGSIYSWGDESPDTFDFYRNGWNDGRPHPVGLRSPNLYGLLDLGDNVHEWCLDWYDSEYYKRSPYHDPVNIEPSSRRASRGGSWRHRIKVSRCAARSSLDPSFGYTDYGFRVVKVVGDRLPSND